MTFQVRGLDEITKEGAQIEKNERNKSSNTLSLINLETVEGAIKGQH